MISSMSCGQNNSSAQKTATTGTSEVVENDSIALIQVFEKLKTNPKFLKDLALENENIFSWNDNMVKIIPGDLDNDGTADALVGFTVEGRGGGNNFDVHYAAFLRKDGEWTYQSQFDAQAGSPDLFYGFKEIKNGMIKGSILHNTDDEYEVPVEFIFKNNQLINTFTALHQTEISEREYLSVSEILSPENVSIPLTATLSEYQKLLGKGTITEPDLTVECGTYFDEGEYRELQYQNLIFELSDQEKAAFRTLIFKNSSYKLQTDKGTITEKTTLKELQSVLYKTDSWWVYEEEDGGKTSAAPDGEESDNQLKFHFDKNGNIVSVRLFIPC
jgi:hypothetical protein